MGKEILSPDKAKVIISKNLAAQIQYLNNKAPKNKEWSGLLIYQLLQGSVTDLKNILIKAEAVFPMDFGDSTFTSFEGDDNWIKCFATFPQIDPISPQPGWYVGKLHTHPDFSVFHSETDKADLYATAPKLPMFLSLIVNYKTETDCELAIAMEVEETVLSRIKWKFKGWKNKESKINKSTNTSNDTYVIKCDVEYEQDQWMIDQVEYLSQKSRTPIYPSYNHNGYNGYERTFEDSYETPGKKQPMVRKFVLTKALNNLAALITLGEGQQLSVKEAIEKANSATAVADVDDYKKAIKMYFGDYWLEPLFFNVDCKYEEVIDAVLIALNNHTGWIVTRIKDAMNELKTEYPELWKVQESPLV